MKSRLQSTIVVLSLLGLAILWTLVLLLLTPDKAGEPTPRGQQSVCEEDMPCWDCHSMGNERCGPNDG